MSADVKTAAKNDARAILIIVVALVAVGIVTIYSAAAVVSERSPRFDDRFLFLRRQCLWACVGMLAMVMTASIPYRFWVRARHLLLAASLLLLVAVYVPGVGLQLNGENRWIRLGSYQVQPSEFCRLTLAIVICAAVAKGVGEWRRFWPWAAVILAAAGLVLFERDIGSALVLATLLGAVLFVGGAKLRHLGLVGGAALAGVAAAVWFFFPSVLRRFGSSYQVDQSVLAVGSGGLFGDGLGAGRAKLYYLPEAQSDFIFAVWAEELGFLGAAGLILLYVALVAVGWRVARRCADPFGRALTFAIVASIILGATINIGVAIGALPAKGIPLPFVSYGGSSLLVSMAAAGILMNIAGETDATTGQRRRDGRPSDAGDRAGAGVAAAQP